LKLKETKKVRKMVSATLRSKKGNALLIALTGISAAAWTLGLITISAQAQTRKRIASDFSRMALNFTVTESVLNRIKQKLVDEVNKPSTGLYTGTLNHLFPPLSNNYNVAYSKGDFTQPFVASPGIKLILPTDPVQASRPLFVAPESDPAVQVRRVNRCLFRIRVNFQYCTSMVGGRLPFVPSTAGLGVPWVPACPANEVRWMQRTAYLNIQSPAFQLTQVTPCVFP
jgi:hypothetical protein